MISTAAPLRAPSGGVYRAFMVGDYVKLGFVDGAHWLRVTSVSKGGLHRALPLSLLSRGEVRFHNGHAIDARPAGRPPDGFVDQLLTWFGVSGN